MNKPKPKHYANLHDDGSVREAPKAKAKKPRKPRVSKAKLDYSIPTFGPLIPRIEGVGFVYMVSITTALGTRYYIGSKSFTKGKCWSTYCTSSPIVQKLIEYSRMHPEAMQVEFTVLEQVRCSAWLKGREDVHMRVMYDRVGKDYCLNVATPLGYSLRTGKKLSR